MNEALFRAIVTVVSGALAGGLTNTVAIWMLFHPYRPPRLWRWRIRILQGAVPKNQVRLAGAIGRAVGDRLLTEKDLSRVLAEPEFRQAFDDGLERFLHEVLEVERGSVRDLLGPEVMAMADPVVEDVLDHAVSRIEQHLESDAFEEAVEERAATLTELFAERPVSDVLTPSREARLSRAAEEWMQGAVSSDGFHRTVSEYLEHAADRLLVPNLTIRDMLPPGVIGTLESAIADFVPLAIRRIAGVLENPGARERVERAIHDVLGRFLQDLKFHQRVVARVVLSGDAVKRVLDTIRVEGAERIAVLFRERKVEEAMAVGIRDAIEDLLDRPVTEVLGNPGDPAVTETSETLTAWLVELVRDPSAQDFVGERVQASLNRASGKTWGELLDDVPPERVSGWVVSAARSDVAGNVYREAGRRLAAALLERPIGRPARWLPANATRAIQAAISEPLWQWLQSQIPSVTGKLDVARRVEEKVRDFPVARMEELVRRVTDRELRLIVYLGYALGAFIGGILVLVNSFL